MTLSPEMATALAGSTITPVLIISLDIAGAAFHAWTGPGVFAPSSSGDVKLDGNQFEPIGNMLNVSDAFEDAGSGAPMTIATHADNLDEPLLAQIVRDRAKWQGREAAVWLGLLAKDDLSVLPNPVRLKTGVITNIEIKDTEEEGAVAVLTVDVDQGDAKGRNLKVKEHSRFYPDDTFGDFVQKLANRPDGLKGAHDVGRGGSPRDIDRFDFY